MPTVQFVRAAENVVVTKSMKTPKRIWDINAWFKAARRAIKELDETMTVDGWFIVRSETTLNYVRWDLENMWQETAQVVIDRTAKFGG